MDKKKSSQKPVKKSAKVARSSGRDAKTTPSKNRTAKSAAAKALRTKPEGKKLAAARSKSAAPSSKRRAAGTASASLGRPTITAEEKLFMLFHDDFHARQIFEFLRAETVGDLEQFSPHEIIHRLSRPIRETVDRIRTRLAGRNRCLAGDEPFAVEHQARAAKSRAEERQA